jgi:hypothetical protein
VGIGVIRPSGPHLFRSASWFPPSLVSFPMLLAVLARTWLHSSPKTHQLLLIHGCLQRFC